jgi:catechol 2,3-dioxygenase-like lactoylglutathione lyase family enzyme
MTTTARLDHIGIGVPDLEVARRYYDGFMQVVGFEEWFPADEHQFNYGPAGVPGTQLFFYRATDDGDHSRHGVGLQHLAFGVADRSVVDRAHRWAVEAGCEVLHEPREFPEYGAGTYATYVVDRHGFVLEVVSHSSGEEPGQA